MKSKAVLLSIVLAGTAGLVAVTAASAQAAAGCRVDYTVTSAWPGGFGAAVSVTNLGDPITSWRLSWSFSAGQTITQLWNGSVSQSAIGWMLSGRSVRSSSPAALSAKVRGSVSSNTPRLASVRSTR